MNTDESMLLSPRTQPDTFSYLSAIHPRPADAPFELTVEPESILFRKVFAEVVVDSCRRRKTWTRCPH